MIIRLVYSGMLVVCGVAVFAFDLLGFILGVVPWDRLLLVLLGCGMFIFMTMILRRTASKPPLALIRDLNHLIKQRRGPLVTDDTFFFVQRWTFPVIGVAVVGVMHMETFTNAMSDLNLGYDVTTVNAEVYMVHGQGVVSREMKGMKVTGTVEEPIFDMPTSNGMAKAIGKALWKSMRDLPFHVRTGVQRVTDDEVRHLVKELAVAQPFNFDD